MIIKAVAINDQLYRDRGQIHPVAAAITNQDDLDYLDKVAERLEKHLQDSLSYPYTAVYRLKYGATYAIQLASAYPILREFGK